MKKKNVLIHYMKADPCHGIKTRTKTGNSPSTIKKKRPDTLYEGRSMSRNKNENKDRKLSKHHQFCGKHFDTINFYFKCTSLKKYGAGLNLQARKLWRKVKFYNIPINTSNTMFPSQFPMETCVCQVLLLEYVQNYAVLVEFH